MDSAEKWALVHGYRNMSAMDLVPPIVCPDCGAECVPTLGADGDPVLKCLSCVAIFHIGLYTYDQMKENIKEISG